MAVVKITKNNFEDEVMKSDVPVLIDFWASWCGPCKMLSPIIEEISDERSDIKVCSVNVDEEEELSTKFNIYSIPALFVVKDGNITNKSAGYMPKEEVLKLL